MRSFNGLADVLAVPATAVMYTKKTFLASGWWKWCPAALLTVFLDLQSVFGELFYVVILLWACDFLIGFLRAVHDPSVRIEWIKIFRSAIKLIVIGVGIVAVHLIENLLMHSGIKTDARLTGAVLIVIGVAESMSVLDNLIYFFPRLAAPAKQIQELLGRVKNAGGPDGS